MKTTWIKIIKDNIYANYKGVARLLNGKFKEYDEVAWYTTGRKSHFRFNGVVFTKTRTDELSKVVDPILEFYLSQNLPFFWSDWPDAGTPGLGDYLKSKDISFMRLDGMPIMTRMLSDLPGLSLPKGVEVVRVQTQMEQTDWLNVMMEGFDEPEPARPDVQMYLANSIAEASPVFEHFLAYWDGIPCAVSSFVRARLGAGIYNVATLPAYRGRGLGRAMTLNVMQSAQKAGYSTSMLFATSSGFPVYKYLGFETVSTGDLYIWNGNG